jgi:hypothetical protein
MEDIESMQMDDDADCGSVEQADSNVISFVTVTSARFGVLPDELIFDNVILWLPVYPFVFPLRRVSKHWRQAIEERLKRFETLDLLQFDHDAIGAHPRYRNFFNLGTTYVNLPVGKGNPMESNGGSGDGGKQVATHPEVTLNGIQPVITRHSVMKYFGACLPNIKNLKFHFGRDMLVPKSFLLDSTLLGQFPFLQDLTIVIH